MQLQNVDDIYALTPMQQMMLVHALTRPDSTVLANQVCYEIRGALSADHFRQAWELLVSRHPALRTAFLWQGLDAPVQVVRSRVSLPFTMVDLGDQPDEEWQRAIELLRHKDLHMPYEIAKAPLLRCTLARIQDNHHVLIWNIHHLIVDRWSHETLFSDLAELYRSVCFNSPSTLAPAVAFREYVVWLKQQDATSAERYWREQLDGFNSPTLVSGGATFDSTAERTSTRRTLSATVTRLLGAMASTCKVTPASVLLAAIALGLARHLQRTDVMYGVTVAGRPPSLEGVEHTVGSFVNNLPLRVRFDSGARVSDWIASIHRAQFQRQSFEHTSLTSLREWADLPVSKPMFDLLVVLNLSANTAAPWPDVQMNAVSATFGAGYPMVLGVSDTGSAIDLTLVRDVDNASGDEILDDIMKSLEDCIAASPSALLSDLLSVAENLHASPRPITASSTHRASSNAQALIAVWEDVLGVKHANLDDNFFDLGGTSLQVVQLMSGVEHATGHVLPLSLLVSAGTLRALVDSLPDSVATVGPVSRIVPLQKGGKRPPIFGIGGQGGHVEFYLPLVRSLGLKHPFFGLATRGLNDTSEVLKTVDDIAEDFARQIVEHTDEEFHLIGRCWGGPVAFELARHLIAHGRPPLSLTLLDPAILKTTTGNEIPNPLLTFLKNRFWLYWHDFRQGDWQSRRSMMHRKWHVAKSMMRSGGLTRSARREINGVYVEHVNIEAVKLYQPDRLNCQARIFFTEGEKTEGASAARAEWTSLLDPAPRVVPIPGASYSNTLTAEHVELFAVALHEWLDEVENGNSVDQNLLS